MEIHSLKISVSEQDVNEAIRRHLPKDQPIEELSVRLAPEGIYVQGIYPFFVNVSFETQWQVAVSEGKVVVQLVNLRAFGMPGNIFKSAILKVIGDAARKQQGVVVENDRLILDPDRMLAQHGLTARTNLKAVCPQQGLLVVDAGRADA
jgi:hypothetical protein